ncbi:MAG: NAD(P)H-dependent oxidoreductase [Methylobacteriaceae bacterium]|nr:NAD(P)H-dependent oxidoreductase [Methylobacteriaceae bacterium]MBV9246608.1 NAD(P)H-dependent oxidoreductase [Methylobacteriaceae bacterium]MBV9703195.1 NAD(P)H-dependent oxidoreductase [Methylobacteriaceae bacterium]
MRVLYIYCHPLPESFHSAIRTAALTGLSAARHEVDQLDLYAEHFDPVLSEEARRRYHDPARNRQGLEAYIARLSAAEGLIVQFPTWCFGPPAMLKGFFDKLLMPGVAFDMSDPMNIRPSLGHIRKLAGIVTYGQPWWTAFIMADPPRKLVKRYLRWFIARNARADFHALYHMNVAGADARTAFIHRVRAAMARF